MNNIITNYQQILNYAKNMQVPLHSQRAIIREYLQSFIISNLYPITDSKLLSFVGGTSLRLLWDLDRFSEDLDFDNLGLNDTQILELIKTVVEQIRRSNIDVELHSSLKEDKNYYEFRFPNLLYDLGITTNDKEKLMIKFDYSSLWKGHNPEMVLFSKYGFITQVTTNSINFILAQKLTAYVYRKQTQPRDIYDIVWLYSKGARLDKKFLEVNSLKNLVKKALEKFKREGVTRTMKARLQPFLFLPDSINKTDLFGKVLESLDNK